MLRSLLCFASISLGAAVESQGGSALASRASAKTLDSSSGEVALHVTRGGKLVRSAAEERERAALLDRAAILLHRIRSERSATEDRARAWQAEERRQRHDSGRGDGRSGRRDRRLHLGGDSLAERQKRELRGLREIKLQGSRGSDKRVESRDHLADTSGVDAIEGKPADQDADAVEGTDEDSGDPDAPGSPQEERSEAEEGGDEEAYPRPSTPGRLRSATPAAQVPAEDSEDSTPDPVKVKVLEDVKKADKAERQQQVDAMQSVLHKARDQAQVLQAELDKKKAAGASPDAADILPDAGRSRADVEAALARPVEEPQPEADAQSDDTQSVADPVEDEQAKSTAASMSHDEQEPNVAAVAGDAAPIAEDATAAPTSKEIPRIGAGLESLNGITSIPVDRLDETEQARLGPEAGVKVVEKLRAQYEMMSNTLKAAQQEEKSLHNIYVSKFSDQSSSAFIALAAVGIIAFLLVTLFAVQQHAPDDHGEPVEDSALPTLARLPKHAPIQALSLAWTLLSSAQCVMVIPDAYGLPQSSECQLFGPRLLLAGSVLLIVVSALGVRRLMRPWNQSRNRTVVLGFIAGQLGVALLYGAANDSSDPLRLGADLRAFALAVARLGLGVCVSFANVGLMMAVKVTPQESMVQFTLYRSGVICVGAAAGALFASASVFWVCTPWILLGGAAFALLPEDLGPLLAKLAATEDAQQALKSSLKGDKADDENLLTASRKTLWLVSAATTLARSMLVASFQTLAAAIFVADFLFQAPDVLLAAGATFACGAFVAPLVVIAKQAGGAPDLGKISTCAGVCAAAAALLFFRPLSHLFVSETAGLWLAFLASALAMPAVHLVGGIMEGIALQQAVPEGPFNQENLVTANLILQDCLSWVIAPAATIYLFSAGGRTLCAMVLLAIASLACAGTITARGALASIANCGATHGAMGPAEETAGKGTECSA